MRTQLPSPQSGAQVFVSLWLVVALVVTSLGAHPAPPVAEAAAPEQASADTPSPSTPTPTLTPSQTVSPTLTPDPATATTTSTSQLTATETISTTATPVLTGTAPLTPGIESPVVAPTFPSPADVVGGDAVTYPPGFEPATAPLSGPTPLSGGGSTPFSTSFSGTTTAFFLADVQCAYGTVRLQGSYTVTTVTGPNPYLAHGVHYDGTSLSTVDVNTYASATYFGQYPAAQTAAGSYTFDQTWGIRDLNAEQLLWTQDINGSISGTITCQPFSTTRTRITRDLVAYYTLDENQGARFNALTFTVPMLNNGTVDGAVGKVGGASRFVKNEVEWLDADNIPEFQSRNRPFSVAMWVRPTAFNYNGCGIAFVSKTASGGAQVGDDYSLGLDVNGTLPGFIYQNGGGFDTFSLSTNQWFFLVGTYDRITRRVGISVNGRPPVPFPWSATDANVGSARLAIGRYSPVSTLLGGLGCGHADAAIDEVGVWNRLLRRQEIAALYNRGNGCAFPFTACSQPVSTRTTSAPSASSGSESGPNNLGGDARECHCDSAQGATGHTGRPINTLTGAMSLSVVDFNLATTAGDLVFQRTYASAMTATYTTTLGFGWTHNQDIRLILPTSPGGEPNTVWFKGQSTNQFRSSITATALIRPMPG